MNPDQKESQFFKILEYIFRWKELDTLQRCMKGLIPAMAMLMMMFDVDGALWARLLNSILSPIIALHLTAIVFSYGAIFLSQTEPEKNMDSIYPCAFVATYLLTFYMVSDSVQKRVEIRETLMDRAEQRLIEVGEKPSVKNLKEAMREIEIDDSIGEAEQAAERAEQGR